MSQTGRPDVPQSQSKLLKSDKHLLALPKHLNRALVNSRLNQAASFSLAILILNKVARFCRAPLGKLKRFCKPFSAQFQSSLRKNWKYYFHWSKCLRRSLRTVRSARPKAWSASSAQPLPTGCVCTNPTASPGSHFELKYFPSQCNTASWLLCEPFSNH